MSELLSVYIIPSEIRTSFFYRNGLENFQHPVKQSSSGTIKIKHGKDFKETIYGYVSLQGLTEVPPKCIGLTSLYANSLGLKETDKVLVSNFSASSIQALDIIPKREEDYIILISCKNFIESNLLNQVRVVTEGQVLPFYVTSNIIVDVEIGKLSPPLKTGLLENFTEVRVLHPIEKMSKSVARCSENDYIQAFNQLFNNKNIGVYNKDHNPAEDVLQHINFAKELNGHFVIWPKSLRPKHIPQRIAEKCIIINSFDDNENSYGPCSRRIFCRIQRADGGLPSEINGQGSIVVNEELPKEMKNCHSENAIILDNSDSIDKRKIMFCPDHIMNKLDLLVGCEIKIKKEDKILNNNSFSLEKMKQKGLRESTISFWKDLDKIKGQVCQSFFNNIKYNTKINSVIIGSPGTGKTWFMNSLKEFFSNEYVFVEELKCKSLQGKKPETISTAWSESLMKCSCHEPSVLLVDDLHALIGSTQEDELVNKLHSDCAVGNIIKYISYFQEKFNITVIATAVDMLELGSLISTHGPKLFGKVHKILEMSADDRYFVLNNIIKCKLKNMNTKGLDLREIANNTSGYSVQDISDLVDKSLLKCLVKCNYTELSQEDLRLAVSESTPMSLKDVKLNELPRTKWEDVGGMYHPKKILMEVFSWPSKYTEVLESCPLRLQRGVLLYGAPGTGKTLLAGALANKCGLNFISVKGPEVLSKYVGASEEGIRNLFVQAQKRKPCLLFFDEFDSLAPKRGHDSTGVTDRVVNQLLTQLDGVEALNGVWVLAATSRPDLLDPALLRPGRLDKMVFCEIPNQDDRLSILTKLSENLAKDGDIDLEEIAAKSEGFTGADLQAILYNAQMFAMKLGGARKGCDAWQSGTGISVSQQNLLSSLEDSKPSLSQSDKIKYEQIYEKFLNSRTKNVTQNYGDGSQKVMFM